MRKKQTLFLASLFVVLAMTAGFVLVKSEKASSATPNVNSQSQGNSVQAKDSAPGSASQNQNQEKNKNMNQGDENQEQEQNQEQNISQKQEKPKIKTNTGQANADSHRSVVANFVKSLLEVAKNEGNGDANGIGTQVRNVAMQQNQGETQTITAMEQIQTRSKIKTFLIGSDYKNLGALRSEMVQTRNRIRQLTELMNKAEGEETKQQLQEQIQLFEQEQEKINQFITENESKISLFGWLAKLFQ